MIEPAPLDERAGEKRGVGQHMAWPDDVFQGGENGVRFRCIHLEEPPRARFRFWAAKDGGDFDMGRKAKLVKRGQGLNLKPAVDKNTRVAGEGRRIA